jgi:thiol-disulfide isomerase/thioredoxin
MNAKVWIVAAGLAIGVPAVQAQDEDKAPQTAGAIDPAARELIDSFRTGIKNVRTLSCLVEQTQISGDQKETRFGEVLVEYDRSGERSVIKKFMVKSKGENAIWAFDGAAAFKLDHGRKTFQTMESDKAFPVAEASMLMPMWASGSDVLANKNAKLTAARLLPEVESDGVTCRVVEYTVVTTYQPMPGDDGKIAEGVEADPPRAVLRQVRRVGKDDLLTRKIESWSTYEGMWPNEPSPRSFVGVYSKVKANTTPETAAYTLTAADGYKTVEADEQDLGIPSDKPPRLKFVEGDNAPPFALMNAAGKEVTLEGLKGKVILLDFWATWCGPCKAAMPHIQKLHETYAAKGVEIIGVSTWENGSSDQVKNDKARKYMDDNDYTYGLLFKGDELAKTYGVPGIPTLVLIGADGKIIHTGVGFTEGEEKHLAELIDKALAKK